MSDEHVQSDLDLEGGEDDASAEDIDPDLLELYEVLEYEAAVEAEANGE